MDLSNCLFADISSQLKDMSQMSQKYSYINLCSECQKLVVEHIYINGYFTGDIIHGLNITLLTATSNLPFNLHSSLLVNINIFQT